MRDRLRIYLLAVGGCTALLCGCDGGGAARTEPRHDSSSPALSPTPLDASGKWSPPRSFHGDPAAQAQIDAEAGILAGRPVRVRWGMPSMELVDSKTGLPLAEYGCMTTDDIQTYTDWYNAAIDTARARGRLREPTRR